jgi:hypothetical protein
MYFLTLSKKYNYELKNQYLHIIKYNKDHTRWYKYVRSQANF